MTSPRQRGDRDAEAGVGACPRLKPFLKIAIFYLIEPFFPTNRVPKNLHAGHPGRQRGGRDAEAGVGATGHQGSGGAPHVVAGCTPTP